MFTTASDQTWWGTLPDRPERPWIDQVRPEVQRTAPPRSTPWTDSSAIKVPTALARAALAGIPVGSRIPGGRHRAAQRSGDRKVPIPDIPVIPDLVVTAFERTWAAKRPGTGPWRMRGLAVIAVAMSAPPGTTVLALCRMLPAEILALQMPRCAWKWVLRWLHARRAFLGSTSDYQPWVTFYGSTGATKQIGWAACQTLHRATLPGWRVSKLLRAGWDAHHRPVPFHRVANYLLAWDAPLRQLARQH